MVSLLHRATINYTKYQLLLMQNHCWFCLILMLSATEERNTAWNWLNPSSLESVTRQWSRLWVSKRIDHLWYKALELALAEEDLVWLVLPCTTTDLVSVLTQRTHNPLYVTGTRSWKWTRHIVFELPGSHSVICNSHLRRHFVGQHVVLCVVKWWRFVALFK